MCHKTRRDLTHLLDTAKWSHLIWRPNPVGRDVSVSSEKIQSIRQQTDMVRLIGSSVALKKAGRNYVGLCPFHAEKSPSFSVSPDKNMFYCFGCHVGGDAFAYVMRHSGLDFHAAARQLGTALGIELEPETPEQRAQQAREHTTSEVNRLALLFFEQNLKEPAAEVARRYLRARRIPAPFAAQRHLGFGGSHEGLQAFFAAHKQPATALTLAGLVSEDGRRQLFAGRLIFPILDAQGRVIGFGGRRLDDDANSPKYINSRENPLFHKRRVLYGLYDAQDALRKSKRVIIVEGYTDVLAMQRAGLEETVAPLGTAFTADHAKSCARLTQQALLLLDADAAGQRAALSAAQQLLRAGLQTAIVTLPAGQDPDSVLREHGPAALQAAVAQARPAVEYFMDVAFAGPQLGIEERARAARDLQPLLGSLTSGLERDLYMSRLAEKVGVGVEQLKRHLVARPAAPKPRPRPAEVTDHDGPPDDAYSPPGATNYRTGPQAADMPDDAPEAFVEHALSAVPPPSAPAPKGEIEMLRELLLYPTLRPRFNELAEFMLTHDMRDLLEALSNPELSIFEVLEARIKDTKLVARLCAIKPVTEGLLDEVIAKSNRTFDDILARLKWRHVDVALRGVLAELKDTETRGQATDELLRRKQELTERKRALRRAGPPAQGVK